MIPRRAVAVTLAAFACGCNDCGTEEIGPAATQIANPPPAGTTAAGITVEVIPRAVYVQPTGTPATATFEIEARLWAPTSYGRERIPPSYGYVPVWSTDQEGLPPDEQWVTVEPLTGYKARVTVKGAFPALPVEAVVSASVSGATSNSSARIVVVSDPASIDEDRVVHEPYSEGGPPAIALVNGMRDLGGGTECTQDSVFAFVRSALLGRLLAKCPVGDGGGGSEVSLFATDHAMLTEAVNWTQAANTVDQQSVQQPVRELPVVLWIAVDGRDLDPNTDLALTELRQKVRDQATDDILQANALFAANRIGVAITLVTGTGNTLTSFPTLAAPGVDCSAADALIAGAVGPSPVAGRLNVYYVNDLGGSLRGLTCKADQNRAEDLVYVAWNAHSPATLAHEVGHSLGLLFPHSGHPDDLTGFDQTNLMESYLDDAHAAARDHLSLGQAFRMNVDAASWLNVDASGPLRDASALRLACPCDPYVSKPCPGLSVDVVPISAGGTLIDPWECADVILLSGTDASHDGVGLLSGHLWRDGPESCTSDAEGRPFHWAGGEQIRLLFDNFSAPGTCPSWLAVFFRDHGMMYRALPGQSSSPITLTDALDNAEWADAPPPPYIVPVHVWTSSSVPALTSLAATDAGTASGTFQGDNRTGIKLDVHEESSVVSADGACAVTPAVADEINIYYVSSADPLYARTQNHDGHWCRVGSTDYIVIATGALWSKTALAHYLGRAFGLGDAKADDGFASSNVMWDQGTDARTAFSLGQVFRMNLDAQSWLNVSPSSPRTGGTRLDCSAIDSAKCPKIAAGAP